MAIHDRWYKDERDGDGDRTGKQERTTEYGCALRWQARWRDPAGNQKKKSFATRKQAETFYAQQLADLASGRYVDPKAGDVTFQAYAEEWRKARMHDPSTAELVEATLRNHAYAADGTPGRLSGGGPSIGYCSLRVLATRPTILQSWIKGLSVGPNTARLVISYVSQVFNAAIEDGLIARNPLQAKSIQKPTPVKVEAVPWTAEQLQAVGQAMPARYREYPEFAVATGQRQSELFAAAVEDIDWLRKTITVKWQVKVVRGVMYFALLKNKKVHDVPLADLVVERIAAHLARFPAAAVTLPNGKPDGPPMTRHLIFTTERGTPLRYSAFNEMWRAAWRQAGVPDRGRKNGNHVTRHTFAARLLSKGLNIAKVAALLGDTQQVVWRTYSHFMPEDDDRAREILNQFFNAAEAASETPLKAVAGGS